MPVRTHARVAAHSNTHVRGHAHTAHADASIEEVPHHGSTDPLIITAVLLARGIPMDTIKAQLPQAHTHTRTHMQAHAHTPARARAC